MKRVRTPKAAELSPERRAEIERDLPAADPKQIAFLDRRLEEVCRQQPAFAKLASTLLAHAGRRVVPRFEEDLAALLRGGQLLDADGARILEGEPSQCHANTARLHVTREWAAWTGWALSPDGLWRQHSWAMTTTGRIVETTEPRLLYYGVHLQGEALEEFLDNNL